DVHSLRNADAHAALFVADHERATEAETLAARNHARHAAHVEHFFLKFFAHHRTRSLRPTRSSIIIVGSSPLWHRHDRDPSSYIFNPPFLAPSAKLFTRP